jgi:hypothetical protein
MEVSFLPGEPPQVLAISGNSQTAATWTLGALTPAHGYVGAIAAEAKDWRLSCWQWPY